MTVLFCELPLGLDGIGILMHVVNLLILVAVLGVLVYKPVQKFMKNRQDAISGQIAENEAKSHEIDAMREEYEARLADIHDQSIAALAESNAKGEQEKAKIIEAARLQADAIVAEARERAERESADAIQEVKSDVVDMAYDIAAGIIEHELTEEDNQRLIDDCLAEWERRNG